MIYSVYLNQVWLFQICIQKWTLAKFLSICVVEDAAEASAGQMFFTLHV